MPDGTLKITKYVIFMLNQIESLARFPGRRVASSTSHLKTSLRLEESEREGHATQRSPGCGDKASIVKFMRSTLNTTCRGIGEGQRFREGFLSTREAWVWLTDRFARGRGIPECGDGLPGWGDRSHGAVSWGSPCAE